MHLDSNKRFAAALAAIALIAAPALAAAIATDLSGQWVGNSQLDGSRTVARTTLVLGAADGEDSSLRIEGRSICELRQGRYSSDGNGGGSISFKEARGGESCDRLAKGTFTLQPGSAPRSLTFEASYPGPDGQPNLRRGALSRYP
jgi:hypothetical protein